MRLPWFRGLGPLSHLGLVGLLVIGGSWPAVYAITLDEALAPPTFEEEPIPDSDQEGAEFERSMEDSSLTEDQPDDTSGGEVGAPYLAVEESIEVQWYFPVLRVSPKPRRIRVVVSGKVEDQATVSLGAPRIPVIIGRRAANVPPAVLLDTELPLETERRGYFEVHLDVPPSTIQLPLRVSMEDGRERIFQLNLVVSEDGAVLEGQPSLARSPAHQKRYEGWFGVGFNYLRYTQDSNLVAQAFESFTGPSFFSKGRARLYRDWAALVEIKMSPGSTSGSGDAELGAIEVGQGAYQWWIYSLEALYMPTFLQGRIFRNPGPWGIRFGLQHHSMPFLLRTQETSFDIVRAQVTMATLGFQHEEEVFRNWDFEIFMRYQHPASGGDVFHISPKFAFDGSLGLIYNFRSGLRVGGFWYGQWHEYNFSQKRPDFDPALQIEGSQSLFFSNVELRLGYAFD